MKDNILASLAILGLFLSSCAHLPDARGGCPSNFPIKGNASSFIYHMPDSKYYFLTSAEWCFKSEEDARNSGYYPSKARAKN
jgi:L-ascorbate metabolism protein UlaG (beta-lactamase superfamily)